MFFLVYDAYFRLNEVKLSLSLTCRVRNEVRYGPQELDIGKNTLFPYFCKKLWVELSDRLAKHFFVIFVIVIIILELKACNSLFDQ